MSEGIVLASVFVLLLGLGVPVAFAIGAATFSSLFVVLDPVAAPTVVAQRMVAGIDSFALLAIPFFILAGNLMNRGGIAGRLIALAQVLVGRIPGGLACVNVMANILFGCISGSAVAAAAANGRVLGPLMTARGYDRDYAAAVNITSATTGMLIPPSNIMVVYSLASGGVSIAALFIAGYVPGLLLGFALMTVAAVTAKRRGYPCGEVVSAREAVRVALAAIPSVMMIVVVMGGIIGGWFTPTEASAIAVLYAFVLAVFVYRQIRWKELPEIFTEAATTTAVVLILVGSSMGMSWAMAIADIPQSISTGLLGLTSNPALLLLIITFVLLGMGTFMDMTPAVLIFTPIFLPVVTELGVDPIHFGIVMIFNLCVGLCTPPVGSVLFVGCGAAGTSIARVWRPMIPFLIATLFILLLVTYVPWLSTGLPQLLGF